jgi:hypothetical protein
MNWQFWQSPSPERIPENVKSILTSQYRLSPQEIEHLRMVKKSGQFAGRPVRFVQIYDPSRLKQANPSQVKYEHLQSGQYRDALLFSGQIEKTGQIFLNDQRRSKDTVNAP